MKTNAARILDQANIKYRILTYHLPQEQFSAERAAALMQVPPDIVFKTLVLKGDRTGPFAACIPSPAELDLKAIARISGNKTADLLPLKDVLPVTGYMRGSVSPIGMKKKLQAYFHDSLLSHDEIGISGGKAGVEILLKPEDLISVTQAVVHPIIKR
ncbi:Cys-tRNA(Pro) deacylase [Paenibacillus humicola]|uniref:Cys-tRNA(Pro) deacylase n=1 Tax=Paenibacillus humicola TaxID=3110540 RepID=UPI00237C0B76|nr:Cys-tRNA(Pro) deacylase [Paenibacillus humicola]